MMLTGRDAKQNPKIGTYDKPSHKPWFFPTCKNKFFSKFISKPSYY